MMTALKGIDVILYTNGTPERISNVLVGEPSADVSADFALFGQSKLTYTLAIPKGDMHEWECKVVEFFGQRFRTVGNAIQGIDELVPLAWNKKIKAEKLIENGACTVYSKDTFERHVFEKVYLNDARYQTVSKDGKHKSGELNVHIYAVNNTTGYVPKVGDIIVNGYCSHKFDVSSQQSISYSMNDFRKNNDYSVINSVKAVAYGNMPDYEIVAR